MPPEDAEITKVRASWDAMSDAYDAAVGTERDIYRHGVMGPGLLEVCGNVSGLRVLDLGCGQGYFTRLLAASGAQAEGVDLSERQILHARRHEREDPLGIAYHVMDAAEVASRWPAGMFDLVVSCIAIQDMPDPLTVLREARGVLGPQGRVVFLTEHPMNTTAYREWDRDASGRKIALRVDRYFDTGRREFAFPHMLNDPEGRLTFPTWSRTLTEWSEVIAGAGLRIVRLHEPRPTPEQVQQVPDLDDCYRMPYFLIFDLVVDGS